MKLNIPGIKRNWFLSAVLLLALVLRLYNLGKYSFWYDETTILLDIRALNSLPFLSKLFNTSYLLKNFDYLKFVYSNGVVYYWNQLFGSSEFALRLSSVIFGILSIYLIYRLAKEFFDIHIAYLTALFLAVSPLHIYYSQELRPYAGAGVLAVVSIYSFLKVLNSGRNKYWAYYILANILGVYFLYTNLLLLFSSAAFFLINIKKYRHLLASFLIAHAAILFLVLPVFLNLYPNLKFVFHNNVEAAFSEFPIWAAERIGFKYLVFTFKDFSVGYGIDCFSFIGGLAVAIYFIIFLTGVAKFYKNRNMQLVLFCLLVPVLLLFSLSQVKVCYVYRYLFPFFPLYLLVICSGLGKITSRFSAILIIAPLVALNFLGLKEYYSNGLPRDQKQFIGEGQKQDIRGAVKFIMGNYQKGDRIMHISKNTVFPLKFYIRQYSGGGDLTREIDNGTVIFVSNFNKKEGIYVLNYESLHPVSFLPQEYKAADKELANAERVWLVFSDFIFPESNSNAFELVKKIKNSGFKKIKLEKFDNVFLYLFNKNSN